MELYSNAYQYLKQKKMKGYVEMKKSGALSWTDKIDPNASFVKVLNSGLKSCEEAGVQEKIGQLRAKLLSGAGLTSTEKEYLKKHDPQLYGKVMELEREQEEYEERLKRSRTRDDAERIKTEKLAEIYAGMDKEDTEYMMIRLIQMQKAEKKTASIVLRKPWQRELDKKRLEIYKKNRKKEDEKIKKKKAEKKRREEAYRKKKMEEKIRQEAAQKEAMRRQMIEEEKVKELMEERRQEEEQIEESIVSEMMTGREMTAEQIAKFMIAAGMMDEKAAEIRVSGQEETTADSVPSTPSLGSTSGYAAYRAAAYMPELADQEKEKKSYIRRA